MRPFWIAVMALAVCAFVPGCGRSADPADVSSAPSQNAAPAQTRPPVDPADAGSVRGTAFFEGEAPVPARLPIKGNPECAVFHPGGAVLSEEIVAADGKLANVFVYVKTGLEGLSFDPPQESVLIENRACVYVPHVAGVRVDQPVVFLNSDPTLHNVHTYARNSKPWNLGLPFQGMKQTKKFTAPEVMVALKCDVHPWMTGYLGVVPHPYFAVSAPDGSFLLKDLPPGEYVLEAWHEKLGVQSQTVRIEPRETREIEFRFKRDA